MEFFLTAQKRSKLRQGVIYIYIRTFLKFGIKIRSQKKVIRVQSRDFCIYAGDFGTLSVCMHVMVGRSKN
jgi:hypothetical protein